MIYLFLGDDRQAKEQQIVEIKASHLTSDNARTLDYELLHAAKLDPDTFKKSLISLPAVAPRRVVILRAPEKLNTQNKNIILEFVEGDHDHIVLVLDSDDTGAKNSLLTKLSKKAKVSRFGGGKKKNIWDATKAMERNDPSTALKIVNGLMDDGELPVKIMGALVWFWGSNKGKLPAERFKKGLLVLQEADLNIKRSRLKPEYAVEVAVTNLSSLIAC